MSRGARIIVLLAGVLLVGCSGSPRWNVLIVTFDTTRADHLDGYKGVKTPTLDRLAAEGFLFEQAYAGAPITLPSHTTILTGLYPPHHGVRDNGLFVVPPKVTTLAEILRAKGYATAAAVGAFPLKKQFGLDQGFDLYDDHLSREYEDLRGHRIRLKEGMFFDERAAQRVNEAIYPWLKSHREERFFAWVHYYDPHQPLDPPNPYDQLYAHDPYAGEIAYADESLGTLFEYLRRLGVWDRTLVVFTADHGEGLDEHREATHSLLVYNATLHVPLIIRVPGGNKTGRTVRVPELVRHVDIVPTILELLGQPVGDRFDGRSLVPYLKGKHPAAPLHYAESLSPRLSHGWGELRALFAGEWKYIHGPRPELFHFSSDPRELDNRILAEPALAARLEHKLAALLRHISAEQPLQAAAPNSETRRRLEALGYIQGGHAEATEIREELSREGVAPQDRVDRTSDLSRVKDLLVRQQPLIAKELLERLMAEDPDSPYYLEMLARTEAALGRFEEAIAVLARLQAKAGAASGAGRLMVEIGRRLARLGRIEEARQQLEQGTRLEPDADAFFLLGALSEQDGRDREAAAAYQRAVEADRAHGPALVALAIRSAKRGERAKAERLFRQAVDNDPYYPKAHYNFGVFLQANGRPADAVERFERAIDLDRDYQQAYQAASLAYRALGRRDEADAVLARGRARVAERGRAAGATAPAEKGKTP